MNIYKIYPFLQSEITKELKTRFGEGNELPLNIEEITDKEYYTIFCSGLPSLLIEKTFRFDGFNYRAIQLWYNQIGTGLMTVQDPKLEKIRFYQFKCKHVFEESQGSNPTRGKYHYSCKYCGVTSKYDSRS